MKITLSKKNRYIQRHLLQDDRCAICGRLFNDSVRYNPLYPEQDIFNHGDFWFLCRRCNLLKGNRIFQSKDECREQLRAILQNTMGDSAFVDVPIDNRLPGEPDFYCDTPLPPSV